MHWCRISNKMQIFHFEDYRCSGEYMFFVTMEHISCLGQPSQMFNLIFNGSWNGYIREMKIKSYSMRKSDQISISKLNQFHKELVTREGNQMRTECGAQKDLSDSRQGSISTQCWQKGKLRPADERHIWSLGDSKCLGNECLAALPFLCLSHSGFSACFRMISFHIVQGSGLWLLWEIAS